MAGPGYSGHAGCVPPFRYRSCAYDNIPLPNRGNATGFCGSRRVYNETNHDKEQCSSHHDLTGVRANASISLSWVGDTLVFLTAVT
ncbi:MAG: hypothetical protein ABFC78_01940 [Methanoregula sp.]